MRKRFLILKRVKIIIFLFTSLLIYASCKNVNSGNNYNLPRINDDANSPSGKTTTWQCVYFGSYPQAEVLDDVKK